jgi:predicted protein tyrosine phosphatase
MKSIIISSAREAVEILLELDAGVDPDPVKVPVLPRAVLSINGTTNMTESPEQRSIDRLARENKIPHKTLLFDDIDEQDQFTGRHGYILPRAFHIDEAINFAETHDEDILLHCAAGISRSTAMAIAIWMHAGVPMEEAVQRVFQQRPRASPNKILLRFVADRHGIPVEDIYKSIMLNKPIKAGY